jgi:hypothetical protein
MPIDPPGSRTHVRDYPRYGRKSKYGHLCLDTWVAVFNLSTARRLRNMEYWTQEDMSVNSNRLLSDQTLREKQERLRSESREQCCFCVLFSAAAAGSIVVATSSHGATLPADIPDIVVSTSSAALCLNECAHKRRDMTAIDEELARRDAAGIRYVDNRQSLSIYSVEHDTLHRVHYPNL